MKKSKWETRYTINLSNGGKITATGSMLNTMCIVFNESARVNNELGCVSIAKKFFNTANEIYNYLESIGYYEE